MCVFPSAECNAVIKVSVGSHFIQTLLEKTKTSIPTQPSRSCWCVEACDFHPSPPRLTRRLLDTLNIPRKLWQTLNWCQIFSAWPALRTNVFVFFSSHVLLCWPPVYASSSTGRCVKTPVFTPDFFAYIADRLCAVRDFAELAISNCMAELQQLSLGIITG